MVAERRGVLAKCTQANQDATISGFVVQIEPTGQAQIVAPPEMRRQFDADAGETRWHMEFFIGNRFPAFDQGETRCLLHPGQVKV